MEVISLNKVFNVRDLGGTVTTDGRKIKHKRLIRGSAIANATDNDLKILKEKYNLAHVLDFRTNDEIKEKPHPTNRIPDVKYVHIPVVKELKTILARDEKSKRLTLEAAKVLTEDDAKKDMTYFYRIIPELEEAQAAYQNLFNTLLQNEEGSVYWHCSMGKDRCGIGSMLVEYALGVPFDSIIQDYLISTKYLKPFIDANIDNIKKHFPFNINIDAFMCFQITLPEYFNATIKTIEEN